MLWNSENNTEMFIMGETTIVLTSKSHPAACEDCLQVGWRDMAKRGKTTPKSSKDKHRARGSKSEDLLDCFYCGGLVHDWNWRCPHCGKLFNSGKRAVAIFVIVILIAAAIGTYPIWRPEPQEESHPLEIVKVTPAPGNTTAYTGAHPTVEFDINHPFDVALIDRESCENAFSITPSIDGYIGWEGFDPYLNRMELMPNSMENDWLLEHWLQLNTTYHIKVTTECKDMNGNRLSEEWNSWFLTEKEYRGQPGG